VASSATLTGWSPEDRCPCFRQSEIQQLRARLGQHDVAGLEIPVHDAGLVRGGEGIRDLNRNLKRLVEWQGALHQAVRQRLALQVLHDEVRRAVLLAHVIERANVRVIELGNRAGFAVEPVAELRIGRKVVGKDLDGDRPIEARVRAL
jgi:hypothetical protein